MSNNILINKSKELAVNIINLCILIKEKQRESVITNQLIRLGTNKNNRSANLQSD